MPVYKFQKNDVYINTLRAYPEIKYRVYNGTASYNNTPNISGSFTGSIRCTDPGSINLFELNVDRGTDAAAAYDREIGVSGVLDTGLIYQFMVKDGNRLGFSSVSSTAFNAGRPGDVFIGEYPYTASITREYYSTVTPRVVSPVITETETGGITVSSSGSVSHIRALKNTLNHYVYLSPFYEYSSSLHTLASRDFEDCELSLINVPTIFYGSKIKPGTIKLDFYVTGTLVGTLEDKNRNGVLYQTGPTDSPGSGSTAGVVLYSEGFVVLTGSWDISTGPHNEDYGTSYTYPNWINYMASLPGSVLAPLSAFMLNMSGTTKTQTMTVFASAPKGELNQSNNPTFVDYFTGSFGTTSSVAYVQNQSLGIKNVVSSAYNSPAASFARTTYVSKIGLYDKNMNLIAIAKPATPIKKTDNRDFTFKIELDI